MILLLDHCVWRPTADYLRHAGFHCVTLRELGRASARNGEVLALATRRRNVLLTRDVDFLAYANSRHTGIIYLRITPTTMDAVHHTLLLALRQFRPAQLRGNLLIVDAITYRLHRPD